MTPSTASPCSCASLYLQRPVRRRLSPGQKALKTRFARPDKFHESDPFEVARLTDGQQDQIPAYSSLSARSSDNVPQKDKLLDGVFCVIVVPGNAVMVQERKERISILFEALTPRLYDIGLLVVTGQLLEEPCNCLLMLLQVITLQAQAIHRLDNRFQQRRKLSY